MKICSKTFDKRSWLLNIRTEFQCHKHSLIKSADLSTLQHWPDLYFRPLIRFHILFKICNAYNQYKICTVYLAYRNVNHEGENIVIWYVWILMVLLFMTNFCNYSVNNLSTRPRALSISSCLFSLSVWVDQKNFDINRFSALVNVCNVFKCHSLTHLSVAYQHCQRWAILKRNTAIH